ncbi:MAG: hypothetical protein IPP66_18425 [Anaerolineales bacterium]|nr:hypothetical protein [Anaerolineales bacterium]
MLTVEIPIKDKKKPPALKFPDRCVNCGKPKYKTLSLKLQMGVQNRGGAVMMDFSPSLCEECNKKESRIINVTLVPFLIAGVIVSVGVFIPVWLIVPDGDTSQTLGFAPTVAAFAGLIAGMIGGSVVEFVLKLLFSAYFGKSLLKRPLTILGLLKDSEEVIGLSAKFTENKKSLVLSFENDEIGKEFKTLNSLEAI